MILVEIHTHTHTHTPVHGQPTQTNVGISNAPTPHPWGYLNMILMWASIQLMREPLLHKMIQPSMALQMLGIHSMLEKKLVLIVTISILEHTCEKHKDTAHHLFGGRRLSSNQDTKYRSY